MLGRGRIRDGIRYQKSLPVTVGLAGHLANSLSHLLACLPFL